MRSLYKFILATILVMSGSGVIGTVSQVANATSRSTTSSLGKAEDIPTNPLIKKGQRIMVVIKDTKKQTVAVYNAQGKKTHQTVKMGSKYTAKAVKKVHGKRIVRVSAKKWLNTKDVTQI